MMKKMFKMLALAIVSVVLCPRLVAQDLSQMQIPELPVDPEVRIGVLPNGLTYYIRHNETPKGQADFYIAQKVGSILEQDNQRGLAHFLEHMCFNGTKHFPGNGIVDWCESVGIKFGANLNAYTSVDQTVYNISNVPVARKGVQDSCLLILHDWANDLLLEPEEIDKERGVIHQEWRRTNVGQMRIIEQLLPVMYPNSPYGYRLPIGTMEVVDNFPYQALRDYYEAWYRPDQQGIIVVGDIDVDRIENKIKEIFSDIEMPADAPERVYFPVADHEGTIYAIGHDPEQTTNIVQMMFLSDPLPREYHNTAIFLQMQYMERMISSMLNERLNEIMSSPNSPFAAASCSFGEYFLAKTKDAFTISAVANGTDVKGALEAVYREAVRAAKGGFTASEYERARSKYLANLENVYNNRESRQTGSYVQEYVDNFLDNDAIPGIEVEYQIMTQIANMISVDVLNEVFAQTMTDDNRVILSLNADNPDGVYPTEEEFVEAVKKVDSETIEAFVDQVKEEPLVANLRPAGTIVKTEELPQWGATEWTLSNGAKVIAKKTDFKKDEIQFMALAKGGTSVLPAKFDTDLRVLDIFLNDNGLGTYSQNDLKKYLAGKKVSLSLSLDDYTRDMSGSTTPKDLGTLMELIYMTMTEYNYTAEEFAALQSTISGIIANQVSSPEYKFQVAVNEALYESPRKQTLNAADVNNANRENIIEIARQMTANAADYTFVFVGNFDEAQLRELVEKYIASLPGDAAKAVTAPVFNAALDIKPGAGINASTARMQTPQSYVFIVDQTNLPYNAKNQKIASVAGQILSQRLLEKIREEMGAVYSIGAAAAMMRVADVNNTILQSQFPMKPEMQDEVLAEIKTIMGQMGENVKPEELAKVKEYMIKSFAEQKELNGPWIGAIGGWTRNGVDTFNGTDTVVDSITTTDIQDFMKALAGSGNYRVVVLGPAAE
ncbi:MAG: insulinase family protein [Muribaculaceae bacterium]|nr:insulinase family protein [Muribaculaceae bacterium]